MHISVTSSSHRATFRCEATRYREADSLRSTSDYCHAILESELHSVLRVRSLTFLRLHVPRGDIREVGIAARDEYADSLPHRGRRLLTIGAQKIQTPLLGTAGSVRVARARAGSLGCEIYHYSSGIVDATRILRPTDLALLVRKRPLPGRVSRSISGSAGCVGSRGKALWSRY